MAMDKTFTARPAWTGEDYSIVGGYISIRDLDGRILARLDTDGLPFSGAHGLAVDSQGSIYACMVGWDPVGAWQCNPDDQRLVKLAKV